MKLLYRYPMINIVLLLGATMFFTLQLPDLRFDNEVLNFLPEDNPARLAVKEQQELFGGVMLIDVVMEAPEGTILQPESLGILRDITRRMEGIPGVEEVESLFSADYIKGTPGGMVVEALIPGEGPYTPEDAAALKEKLISWKIYHGLLISRDYSATQIGVRYSTELSPEERETIYRKILEITGTYAETPYRFHVAGTPALTVLVSSNMRSDLKTLVPFVLIVLLLVLSLTFRRLMGVLLPMITVSISTVWIIGIMALLQIPLSILGTVIPVLMLAVGSAYGIHLMSRYFDEADPEEAQREIVYRTLRHVGQPVALAGITTIIGFGSLGVSQIVPIRSFGIFTALGVVIALITALLFLPSVLLLSRQPYQKRRSDTGSGGILMRILLEKLLARTTKGRTAVLIIALLVSLGAAWGAGQLIVDNALVEYFKESTHIRVSDRFIREKFVGTKSFDIIISGEQPGDMADPRILADMDKLAAYLEKNYPQVAKVVSFSDFIRRMNQVMHVDEPGKPGFGNIPAADSSWSDSEEWSESTFSLNGPKSGTKHDPWAEAAAWSADPEIQETEQDGTAAADPYSAASGLLFQAYTEADTMEIGTSELIRLTGVITNRDGLAWDEIPVDPLRYGLESSEDLRNLISQYLLLYSGSLDSFADDGLEPRTARMVVSLSTPGNIFTKELLPAIEAFVSKNFPPGYSVGYAGIALAEKAVSDLVTGAAIQSILLSLAAVFIIVSLNYRSLAVGLIGAVPLGLNVLINFGVMGISGIKLDIATSMVGSVAIGIGIDYTIHFLCAYRQARLVREDVSQVTASALRTSGKAIIYNALSVAAGFLVLGFSRFNPLMYLGILISLTMITSAVASLTVVPGLLNTFKPAGMARSPGPHLTNQKEDM
ncbi:MMPL family transporter [Marispirochaeta aestuarii]|uniref:efflux RND transporter permease subunit n=1 Tax=Marispirochaeta aestuarii TaxID=1963862 RepID=UPI002ABDBF5B|nr:MMPL family transporter [Marispirochaeta aestuarii]